MALLLIAERAVTPWRSGQRFLTFEETLVAPMVAMIVPEERCVNASERQRSVSALYSSPKSNKPCQQRIGLYTHMHGRSGGPSNDNQMDVKRTFVSLSSYAACARSRSAVLDRSPVGRSLQSKRYVITK